MKYLSFLNVILVMNIKKESWVYIKTIVDVVSEPVLILDKDLCVVTANEAFYDMFQVDPKTTEGKLIYELGNGQWNILALKKLLEDILPKNTFFKGFEVTHEFPFIGRKVMLLTARQIYTKSILNITDKKLCPPMILLAMEDVTEMILTAETLASHVKKIETTLLERTDMLESNYVKMEKEINKLKNK